MKWFMDKIFEIFCNKIALQAKLIKENVPQARFF